MRRLLGSAALAVTLSIVAAGGAISQTPSPSGPATELAEMNNTEVALARTAMTRAQSPAVRAFADMMVKEHSASLTKLRDVEGVTTNVKPNVKHQATVDRLSNLSGMEFDREYMRVMITDHEEALTFLETQSKFGKTSLSKTCEKMIPTVREHLQEAHKIQKDLAIHAQRASRYNR